MSSVVDYGFTNPQRVGPGVWYMMFLMAVHAEDKTQRFWVCNQIRLFCDTFGCKMCAGHCLIYIKNNPPEDHIEERYDLFDWLVKFENSVSVRIGHPVKDRDTIFKLFTEIDVGVCEKNCGEPKAKKMPSRTGILIPRDYFRLDLIHDM